MNNSNTSSSQAVSRLAAEIKRASSPPSISTVDESDLAPHAPLPPDTNAWLIFGLPENRRIALLRATVSSMEWQPHPHSLRLNTQQDGVILLDLSTLDLGLGQALWRDLVAGKIDEAEASFEVLPVE